MDQIKDGRRHVLIHGNKDAEDLPVEGLPELPSVASDEPFVPTNMEDPKLYPGDVIVGVYDEMISFAELILDKADGHVLVLDLENGHQILHGDQQFSSRFYQADEVHVYDNIADVDDGWDATFDESKLERPEAGRPR